MFSFARKSTNRGTFRVNHMNSNIFNRVKYIPKNTTTSLSTQNRSLSVDSIRSGVSDFRVRLAEKRADYRKNDPYFQTDLLRLLNESGQPHQVIQRYESDEFVFDEKARAEYLKALSQLANINYENTKSMENFHSSKQFSPQLSPQQAQPQNSPYNSNPLAQQYYQQWYQQWYQYQQQQQQQMQNQYQQQQHQQQQQQPYSSSYPPPHVTPSQQVQTPFDGKTDFANAYAQGYGRSDKPMHIEMMPAKQSNRGLMFLLAIALLVFINMLLGRQRGMGDNIGNLFGMAGEYKPQSAPETRFDDVVGCDEAKEDLVEVVEFLRNPDKFTRLGGKIPKGVLLAGPPGTGKTLLAKAVAGEAEVPFFYASASEFEEVFVGLGARRIRELWSSARSHAPCIIFIDEIDALASRKEHESNSLRMTLNQLLSEMDGFTPADQIIVIAATNFPQTLDKALTRSGRFDKHVSVPLPDIHGRQELLKLYLKDKRIANDLNTNAIARGTPRFTGADISNMVNIAALSAATRGKESIDMDELENAKDRIMMGAEKAGGAKLIDREKLLKTAYHEAGHALVGVKTNGSKPIHRATIIPRGGALGMVKHLLKDEQTETCEELLADVDVAMGGRLAEEQIYGSEHVSTGASSDIQSATAVARDMVTLYGMSPLGPVNLQDTKDQQFPSGEMKSKIDKEIRSILTDSESRAKKVIQSNEPALHNLANALMEYETLTGEEVRDIVNGKKITRRPDVSIQEFAKKSNSSKDVQGRLDVAATPIFKK